MAKKRSMVFPTIITAIIIIIIIYLFATVKQPYVECSKKTVDDFGITIKEELKTELDSNKISKMTLSKTIILPDKYLSDDKYLEAFKFAIKKSYEYLDDTDVKVTSGDNYILVTINASSKETLILNNLDLLTYIRFKVLINDFNVTNLEFALSYFLSIFIYSVIIFSPASAVYLE